MGCITPAFSGAQKRAEIGCCTRILGDPPKKGDKIRTKKLTPTFSGAQKRDKMLCHPCILRDPRTKGIKIRVGCLTRAFSGIAKQRGTKSELEASPLPS